MGLPHVIAIPSPVQGHVIPMLELMQNIATSGFKVTFVNTELNHQRLMNAMPKGANVGNVINFVSIPNGLEPWDDENDWERSLEMMGRVMPVKLEELIQKFDESVDDKITCLIADQTMGWPLYVAEKLQIKRAVFWPAATATLAFLFSIQKMIDDGIVDNRGTSIKNQMIQLSPKMPKLRTVDLPWACHWNSHTQEMIFHMVLENNKSLQAANWLICNSFYELEPAALSLFPNIISIGPLLSTNHLGKPTGYFMKEDSTCLEWLDQHPPNSVIYVAFGSSTVFDESQFKELAWGLELINRPFLWVVRPDLTDEVDKAYPKGFLERVSSTHGRIVGWAPQQAVLSHPSIACFMSHCGWNSTLEGVGKGIPFLCWPYFGDQFVNQRYICDIWKIGLGFDRDERGVITRVEIKKKVEKLLECKSFRARALVLKKLAAESVKEGGHSHNNFSNFIKWMKN